MATKTAKQIEGDFFRLLKESDLIKKLSGDVYREGQRAKNSTKEDIVVIYTAGLNGQIQRGTITVQVFVAGLQDTREGAEDLIIEDGRRCEEVERMSQKWVDSLSLAKIPYKIEQQQTIHTRWIEDIKQSAVIIKLNYEYCSI